MITKELDYFSINNRYGGSQQWMTDPWMKLGGCGALAAVDSSIYFSKYFGGKKIYENPTKITKSRYITLAGEMKPFLRPRSGGINKLGIYTDGYRDFLEYKGFKPEKIRMEAYSMGRPADDAWNVYKKQIDDGYLVPVLLLKPASKEWKDYYWHWFVLNAYRIDEESGKRYVKAVTWGNYQWLSFDGFWDEERADNGGMILYKI